MVYGGAVAVVGGILLILYLLLGNIGSGPPEVGSVTVRCGGVSAPPLSNEIYVTADKNKTEKRRLVPEEIWEQAPQFVYRNGLNVSFDKGSAVEGLTFTVYDRENNAILQRADTFSVPEEPGEYLVCEELYWGTAQNNIGMEYYFRLSIGQ